jgi:hypothetical protein
VEINIYYKILPSNKTCFCLCVLLWGSFVHRMLVDMCVYHMSQKNFILVFSDLCWHRSVHWPLSILTVGYKFLFIWGAQINNFFLLTWEIIFAYTSFLLQTDCCRWYLLLAVIGSWICSSAQNITTSLCSLHRSSCIAVCLIILVAILGSELLSVLIILLWLDPRECLWVVFTGRLVPSAYAFSIQLKCCCCLCIG